MPSPAASAHARGSVFTQLLPGQSRKQWGMRHRVQVHMCKLTSSVSPRSLSTSADFIQMRSFASVARAFARMPRARPISLFSNSILKAASQICSLSARGVPKLL